MIPKDCKRLAEVDFPIAVVSKHAAREKSIRHGHPSTLHLWWARRPLAACRAMLLGLLLPDPCDPLCPEDFRHKARRLLPRVGCGDGETDEKLRHGLLKFIGDFANWDVAAKQSYLEVARGLVRAAHDAEPPLVVDPFAGGGSIPLEALRLGCEAFASDLNPVACLILKVMLEDIPRHGPQLAADLRRIGAEIKRQAEKELAELYPTEPDGATPIAYLWARTVQCEAPNCGAEIPLVRSFWLCKKVNRRRALKPRVERPRGEPPRVSFEVFEPKAEQDVPAGTVTRARATCLCCGTVLPPERVRAQLAVQRGGADVVFDAQGRRKGGARLLAVVTLRSGETGRHYRLPTMRDYDAVHQAQARIAKMLDEWEHGGRQGLCPVPDEDISLNEIRRISVPIYGMKSWGDLFTARQKVAVAMLANQTQMAADGSAVHELLALALTRSANASCSLCRWHVSGEKHEGAFSRQALPIVWDYSEGNPFSDSTGGYEGALDWVAKVAEAWPGSRPGQLQLADAAEHPLLDETAQVWFTDPPYYDAVPYAHLADFFLVWLKRALPGHSLLHDPSDPTKPVTPKMREIVVDRPHRLSSSPKDAKFYEAGMARAFGEGRRVLREDGVGSVVFAHKTTEGWEALLSGMIHGGWTITASWPVATEMGARLNARETASLATSVHLVCRPRPDDAPIGDWGDVLRELPKRVGDWMERLQGEGVRGADLVFACIGPALEIFSRYTKVETAEGQEVTLPECLEKVWEVVGRTALEQVLGSGEAQARNGSAGALEEDARLTALFLWTLQSTNGEGNDSAADSDADEPEDLDEDAEEDAPRGKPKGFSLVFDVVRRFAQPLGIHLPAWEGRIIETMKGFVRLLAVTERATQLFGDTGTQTIAEQLERSTTGTAQLTLFPGSPTGAVPRGRGQGRRRRSPVDVDDESLSTQREATTLDRVHAAMLLQSSGHTNALRALLADEQERGTDFLRLANALSALYPRGSEEKRLLDAMLLAVPR
jgi:adenine-specific DNA methylase